MFSGFNHKYKKKSSEIGCQCFVFLLFFSSSSFFLCFIFLKGNKSIISTKISTIHLVKLSKMEAIAAALVRFYHDFENRQVEPKRGKHSFSPVTSDSIIKKWENNKQSKLSFYILIKMFSTQIYDAFKKMILKTILYVSLFKKDNEFLFTSCYNIKLLIQGYMRVWYSDFIHRINILFLNLDVGGMCISISYFKTQRR